MMTTSSSKTPSGSRPRATWVKRRTSPVCVEGRREGGDGEGGTGGQRHFEPEELKKLLMSISLSQQCHLLAERKSAVHTRVELQLGLLSEVALGEGEPVPGGPSLEHRGPVDGSNDRDQDPEQRTWKDIKSGSGSSQTPPGVGGDVGVCEVPVPGHIVLI